HGGHVVLRIQLHERCVLMVGAGREVCSCSHARERDHRRGERPAARCQSSRHVDASPCRWGNREAGWLLLCPAVRPSAGIGWVRPVQSIRLRTRCVCQLEADRGEVTGFEMSESPANRVEGVQVCSTALLPLQVGSRRLTWGELPAPEAGRREGSEVLSRRLSREELPNDDTCNSGEQDTISTVPCRVPESLQSRLGADDRETVGRDGSEARPGPMYLGTIERGA